jgi:hypothetical protein
MGCHPLSSITSNVTELRSEHYSNLGAAISRLLGHIYCRATSHSRTYNSGWLWLVAMGSQVFDKSFRAVAFDAMQIQLECLK